MKPRRTCHACERPLRKGKSRRALILTHEGAITGLVCLRCALRSLPFVIPPPVTVATLCTECKRGRASVCLDCVTRVGAHVKELSAANVVLRAVRPKDD